MGAFEDAQRRNIQKQLAAGAITQAQANAALAGVNQAERTGSVYTGKGSSTYTETDYSRNSGGNYSSNNSTRSSSNKSSSSRASSSRASSQTKSSPSGSYFPYEDLLRDLLAKTPTYTPRTESELRRVAESKVEQQLESLLSAIASRRSAEEAKYSSGKSDIEAAYADIPARTQQRLEEVRRSALESAISRGMGRSGVVDWLTEKSSMPILQEEAQANAEKAAKLSALTNSYNALLSDLARQEQTILGGRQSLIDSLLNDLMQQEYGYGRQSSSDIWSQAMGLAGLANAANQYQQSDLYNMLQQLLYG